MRIWHFIKTLFSIVWETIVKFIREDGLSYSASIAFFTIFSLPGVLVIVVLIAGFFFGETAVQGSLADEIQDLVGEASAEQIQNILRNIRENEYTVIAAFIGLGTLLYGATSVFISIQDGLNSLWGLRPRPRSSVLRFFIDRMLSFAMVVSMGFLMLVSLVIDMTLVFFREFLERILPSGTVYLMEVIHFTVSVAVIFAIFALIYKILPHGKVRGRDIATGAAIATGLFVVGKFLIGFYLGNSSLGTAYGSAGSLVLFLIWVYFSAIILLFGAAIVEVITRRMGYPIGPGKDTVKIVTKEITPEEWDPKKGRD